MPLGLIPLLVLMILGAIVALESKDLLSGVISLGICGFGLTIAFLLLQAPDLAIIQIIIETLTLVILIAALLKTTREDTTEHFGLRKAFVWLVGGAVIAVLLLVTVRVFRSLPPFGFPELRMAEYYLRQGLPMTGAANLVAAIILDFRGYDTLGEATVLFTSVAGAAAVLRHIGRKRP